MQLPLAPSEPDLGPEKSLSAGALAATRDPEAVAELQWRSAMPISAVLLCLLAVPLGRTDPRQGRAARVFLAALLYVVYRTLARHREELGGRRRPAAGSGSLARARRPVCSSRSASGARSARCAA